MKPPFTSFEASNHTLVIGSYWELSGVIGSYQELLGVIGSYLELSKVYPS